MLVKRKVGGCPSLGGGPPLVQRLASQLFPGELRTLTHRIWPSGPKRGSPSQLVHLDLITLVVV